MDLARYAILCGIPRVLPEEPTCYEEGSMLRLYHEAFRHGLGWTCLTRWDWENLPHEFWIHLHVHQDAIYLFKRSTLQDDSICRLNNQNLRT
ncbi:hypothetical protein AVEN_89875-1 [Araneus ventricosus]|uniref:Uncharacterized protein n=1 Tax=Araneus ventricosus TaxID=182803 RepID=A0A4Y2UPC2_ARAVE|nr:hypothetical protein AVEN_89875-1 [Araneus ventricosus]